MAEYRQDRCPYRSITHPVRLTPRPKKAGLFSTLIIHLYHPMNCFITRKRRRAPSQACLMQNDLESAHLQAKSIGKPVAWAPQQPFSMFGREGDALMINADGLCRRVRLWNQENRMWSWFNTPVFDPRTKTLDPSTHTQVKAA